MTSRPWIALCAALTGSALIVFSAVAAPITERQKRDCRTDYQRFCSEYGLETEGLRACMSRSFKKLTNSCVAALVAADVNAGRIAGMNTGGGPTVDIRIDCNGEAVLARLTRQSTHALGLKLGQPVYAVVKTLSFDRGNTARAVRLDA